MPMTSPARKSRRRSRCFLPESKTTRYEAFDRPLFEAKVKAALRRLQVPLLQRRPGRRQAAAAGRVGPDPGRRRPRPRRGRRRRRRATGQPGQAEEDPGHRLRPADLRHRLRLLRLLQQRQGRRDAGPGAARRARPGAARPQGQIVMINGSPTDPSSADYKKGAHNVLDGKVTHRARVRHPGLEPGQGPAGDGAGDHRAGPGHRRRRAVHKGSTMTTEQLVVCPTRSTN